MRCRSWRLRKWWFRRCTWKQGHAAESLWHCDETSCTTWLVADRGRERALKRVKD
ncbi:hypothetical protein [Actinoallomurus sp. NPDC052274]|uniref:hypothetical protein n=1 Tax=Actinoallomurus sp. NPDC052274 TaxID=3155420 RepID=UPI003432E3EC